MEEFGAEATVASERCQDKLQADVNRSLGLLCDYVLAGYGSPGDVSAQAPLVEARALLAEVYKDADFRHLYSDILPILLMKTNDEGLEQIQAMRDMAGEVSRLLFDISKELAADSAVSCKVRKLADQVKLEYQRLDLIAGCFTTKGEAAELRGEVASMKEAVKRATADIEASQKAAEDIKQRYERESMTILGILSAAMFTVTGGMSFAASGVNQVAGMHPMHILLVVLAVGFVLLNISAALFTFLRRSLMPADEAAWGRLPVAAFFAVDAALLASLVVVFTAVLDAYA